MLPTCGCLNLQIIGRDIKASAGMRVRLSNAGKQYIKIYDAKHGLVRLGALSLAGIIGMHSHPRADSSGPSACLHRPRKQPISAKLTRQKDWAFGRAHVCQTHTAFTRQHYYDEGLGTIVANGRGTYLGLCDVEWDSGNKPDIDNTYFIYNSGNDGQYHLALVEDPSWGVDAEDVLGMREEDLKRLQARQASKAKEASKLGSTAPNTGAASALSMPKSASSRNLLSKTGSTRYL